MLGDFGKRYKDFKDDFLKIRGFKFNGSLKIGKPGWIFNDDLMIDLEKQLKRYKIDYKKMSNDQYQKYKPEPSKNPSIRISKLLKR